MASFYLIRKDQPLGEPDMLACWELQIPEDSDWPTVATKFATDQGFPVDAIAMVVDPAASSVETAIQTFKLEQRWAPYAE